MSAAGVLFALLLCYSACVRVCMRVDSSVCITIVFEYLSICGALFSCNVVFVSLPLYSCRDFTLPRLGS